MPRLAVKNRSNDNADDQDAGRILTSRSVNASPSQSGGDNDGAAVSQQHQPQQQRSSLASNHSDNSSHINENGNDRTSNNQHQNGDAPPRISSFFSNNNNNAFILSHHHQGRRAKRKMIQLPPIDPVLHRAISKHCKKQIIINQQNNDLNSSSANDSTTTKTASLWSRYENAQAVVAEKKSDLVKAQSKWKSLGEEHAEKLQAIQQRGQKEMQTALTKLQSTLETDHQNEMEQKRNAWKRQRIELQKEMALRLQQKKIELEKGIEMENAIINKYEENLKSMVVDESSTMPALDNKKNDDNPENEIQAKDKKKNVSENVRRKQRELEGLQDTLSHLTETKSQMVWLLKQVIKAEQKNRPSNKSNTTTTTKTTDGGPVEDHLPAHNDGNAMDRT